MLLLQGGSVAQWLGRWIHHDLGDTGIITFGIAIVTEVSHVSHNTSWDCLEQLVDQFVEGIFTGVLVTVCWSVRYHNGDRNGTVELQHS